MLYMCISDKSMGKENYTATVLKLSNNMKENGMMSLYLLI